MTIGNPFLNRLTKKMNIAKLKHNKKIIRLIRRCFLESSIYPKIKNLIIHGSGLYQKIDQADKYHDIDLELILENTPSSRDVKIIRDIITSFPIKIECQIRSIKEISDKKSLIFISGYKIFMYYAYANGISLIGKNIYKKIIKKFTLDEFYRSSRIQAQIHFKDIRKCYLSCKSDYEINKNIMRFLKEICVLEGFLPIEKTGTQLYWNNEQNSFVNLLERKYKNFLTRGERGKLKRYMTDYKNSIFREENLFVINKILRIFEERYFAKNKK